MERTIALAYGLLAYAAFLATILYAIGFVGNFVVPKSIDSGPVVPAPEAFWINTLLLGLFAVQHSVMARPAFKSWWTRLVPKPVERSTFVLIASLLVMLLMWQWRAMPAIVWHIQQPLIRAPLIALSLAGWLLVFYTSFVIDHFDLFGLRQVFLYLRNRDYVHPPFMERSVYKLVRHPLMAGFLVAFWVTPTMTAGHLLFAVLATAYILVGITLEERDLLSILGQEYRGYRTRTPMLLPWGRRTTPERSAHGV